MLGEWLMEFIARDQANGMSAEEIRQLWQQLGKLAQVAPGVVKVDIFAVQEYLQTLVRPR